jgi:hypothetical protein
MRFLILTLIINFWSYSALGAAEVREASQIHAFRPKDPVVRVNKRYLESCAQQQQKLFPTPAERLEQELHAYLKITNPTHKDIKEDTLYQTFVVSNEHGQKKTLHQLQTAKSTAKKNKTLVGVSGPDLFNQAIASKADYLIVIDSCPSMILFWKSLRQIILTCSDRRQAADEFIKLISSHEEWFSGFAMNEDIHVFVSKKEAALQGEENEFFWFCSDENFAFIKDLAQRRLLLCHFSITDKTRICKLRDWLDRMQMSLDTVYLSNALCWVKKSWENNHRYGDHCEYITPLSRGLDYFLGKRGTKVPIVIYSKKDCPRHKHHKTHAKRYLTDSNTFLYFVLFDLIAPYS